MESPYDALAASLRSGDIDFILGALRRASDAKDLQQEALFDDRISVIARAAHPLSRVGRIDFDALRQATWVLSRHDSPSRERLERFFRESRQGPPVPAVETGERAVLRGLLIGLTQRLGAFPAPGARALMEEIRSVVARSPDSRA